MESKAKFLGHALHPILVVFPLGLLATTAIFDTVYLVSGNRTMAVVAYWMIFAGVIGGLVAAIFGLIDWLAIPTKTRAKTIGMLHGGINLVVLLLFLGSYWSRRAAPDNPLLVAHILSYIGVGLALIGGWLGGELVERLGVGVDPGAHLDAPNSLSNRPARDTTAEI